MRTFGLSQKAIVGLVFVVFIALAVVIYLAQAWVERDAFSRDAGVANLAAQRQVDKLTAEIRRIRSETGGSLFWLKMIGLFVTVGGAVGGYLLGQSQATRARLDFEHRKDVDLAYQAIVQELCAKESPLLRAAAVVKLGALLQDFPSEWNVSPQRQKQLIQSTKHILAVSLAIEEEPKVLKALTIAIALHHPWENDATAAAKKQYGDLRGLDLSGARATDAYWARVDFTGADFYRANLSQASFRKACLCKAQFREADLQKAVLVETDCEGANFKRADLRGADLSQAKLVGVNFEDAKVFDVKLARATLGDNPEGRVDLSSTGEGSQKISIREWLEQHSSTS